MIRDTDMKPSLIINGAAGRMGRRVISMAAESEAFNIIAAVDIATHPDIGKDAGLLAGIGEIGVNITSEYPETADVMIDFSLPQATDATVEYCAKNGIALILATTGLTDSQLKSLKNAAGKIPIVYATNLSVGMNVLFATVGKVAKMLGEDYDIEITEAHHRFKKDSPSGTALSLAQAIAEETDRKYPDCLVHGRQGTDALRKKGTIGMHAIRAGDITGQHSVIYSALGETVTISHNAHNRDNFARGAVRAAKWVIDKEPSLYSMKNVLGIE
ncbi:MAG: 4-hydroxy-tetrahydrodipicolinate reductase [Planctomycetes bacterium]|nr:4-hydroxy-tetrahydrodipicolinate reductase [Planctomycetota bacterium]